MKLKYLFIFIVIALISVFTYRFFLIGWSPKQNDSLSTLTELSQQQKNLISTPSKEEQYEEHLNLPWADFVYPVQTDIRDPFQRWEVQVESQVEEEKKSPSAVMLAGVIYGEKNPVAIFTDREGNSYLVKENDVISDYIVKTISKRSVTLRRHNMDIEFSVFDEERLSKTSSPQIQKENKKGI